MKKNSSSNSQDILYFYQSLKSCKRIKQDTVFHEQHYTLYKKYQEKRNICEQEQNSQFFKNYNFNQKIKNNPVSYVRSSLLRDELKKLKNRIYTPSISLDLHGTNQDQAKKELGNLIFICYTKKISCCSIIHGHGKNILKNQIPIWLSQHPSILAFYQASNKFGSNTMLLVLIEHNNNDI